MKRIILASVFIVLCCSAPQPVAADGCTCPQSYMPIWATSIVCMGSPQEKLSCPKGSEFDDSLDLCVAESDEDGECPQGMERATYGDRCMSDRIVSLSCGTGGRYDKVLNICVLPCGLARIPKPAEVPPEE